MKLGVVDIRIGSRSPTPSLIYLNILPKLPSLAKDLNPTQARSDEIRKIIIALQISLFLGERGAAKDLGVLYYEIQNYEEKYDLGWKPGIDELYYALWKKLYNPNIPQYSNKMQFDYIDSLAGKYANAIQENESEYNNIKLETGSDELNDRIIQMAIERIGNVDPSNTIEILFQDNSDLYWPSDHENTENTPLLGDSHKSESSCCGCCNIM